MLVVHIIWTIIVLSVAAFIGAFMTYDPRGEDNMVMGFIAFMVVNIVGQVMFYGFSKSRVSTSPSTDQPTKKGDHMAVTASMIVTICFLVFLMCFLPMLGFFGVLPESLFYPAELGLVAIIIYLIYKIVRRRG